MTTENTSTEKTMTNPETRFNRFSNHPYKPPVKGRLPLVAYLPNKVAQPIDAEMCGHVQGCGLNTVITSVGFPANNIKQSMATAWEKGLKTIVMHAHLSPTTERSEEAQLKLCRALVDYVASEPGAGGFFTGRNPSFSDLGKINSFVNEIDGQHIGSPIAESPLILSMLGEQALPPDFQLPDENMPATYLAQALVCLGPSVWWANSDAWKKKADGQYEVRYRDYLNNLELMVLMSEYTLRPFWSTVKCIPASYTDSSDPTHKTASGVMLFSAMSALARGAQGLVVTDFRQALSLGGSSGAFSKETLKPTWEEVAPVVKRVHDLEAVFLNSYQIETVHTGAIPGADVKFVSGVTQEAISRYLYSFMEVAVGPLLKVETADGSGAKGVMVSHLCQMPERSMLCREDFDGELMEFLVIVNHDTENEQTVTLTFGPTEKLTVVTSARITDAEDRSKNHLEETLLTPDAEGRVSRTIAPGDALVIHWK